MMLCKILWQPLEAAVLSVQAFVAHDAAAVAVVAAVVVAVARVVAAALLLRLVVEQPAAVDVVVRHGRNWVELEHHLIVLGRRW